MTVVVLGAGVVGVAAAYSLARDGREVVVIDRHPGPAHGTSYSNAGLLSPGDATAWASPAALKTFVRSLFNPNLGIRLRLRQHPYFLPWSLRFLAQCTEKRCRANTDVKLRLALYSRDILEEIVRDTGISFDRRANGILYFFRSQESLDGGTGNLRYLADHGLQIEVLDRDGVVRREPGLATARDRIAGGIFSPMDETGDSRLFVAALADVATTRLGVKFRYSTNVTGLEIDGDKVRAVLTSSGRVKASAVVIAMGPESGLLGRKYGIDLPVYPVKGYTATVPLRDPALGPTMGGVDEDRLIAYSRLGNRLRLAATAEFAGYDRSYRSEDFDALFQTAQELFPGAFDRSEAELWAGLRPMMPNSVPVIGRARYRNLYLNTGHGHVGWTMAAGSGKFLADHVAGRQTAIDGAGLLYKG